MIKIYCYHHIAVKLVDHALAVVRKPLPNISRSAPAVNTFSMKATMNLSKFTRQIFVCVPFIKILPHQTFALYSNSLCM